MEAKIIDGFLRGVKSKSKANVLAGLTYQIINTVMGLILPYLFITQFGSETNGLLNSITQLYVYLQIFEAGVGTATRQALYKPLIKNDKKSVNSILAATHIYYKRTGYLYFAFVVLLSLIYPYLVVSQISYKTITLVILLQGFASAWSYYVQAKYNVLLRADGRVYVQYALLLCSSILRNAGKIIAIKLGCDIIIVQAINLLVAMIESFLVILYIKKRFKWLNFKCKPDFTAINQKNYVLIQWIAWLIFNHTDVMMLTLICRDLRIVSVYSLYTLVFTAIQNVLESIRNSYQFKIGQMYSVSHGDATCYYRKYRVIYTVVMFALCTTCMILISPFISLYTKNVRDTNYLLKYLPELFFLSNVFYSLREVYRQPIDAAGHFKRSQYIVVLEMILNLSITFALISRYSIHGALIGTIIALAIGLVMTIKYDYTHILVKSYMKDDFILIVACGIIAAAFCRGRSLLTVGIDSYLQLVFRSVAIAMAVGIVYAVFYIIATKVYFILDNRNT